MIDDMIWWLICERAYDNNIRKILKYFQKQRLWWEHHNILENCAITLCWGETSSKFCIIVKTSASWVNNCIRLHTLKRDIFLRSFFLKISDIISLHQNDALLDKSFVSRWLRFVKLSVLARFRFFSLFEGRAGLPRRSHARATLWLFVLFHKSVSEDLFVD